MPSLRYFSKPSPVTVDLGSAFGMYLTLSILYFSSPIIMRRAFSVSVKQVYPVTGCDSSVKWVIPKLFVLFLVFLSRILFVFYTNTLVPGFVLNPSISVNR